MWSKTPHWWQIWVVLELIGLLKGGWTLEVDRDLNLGQFGLIWQKKKYENDDKWGQIQILYLT